MRTLFSIIVCLGWTLTSIAQDFSSYFENKTLRADYIFSGDKQRQDVVLDELSSLPSWAGRRVNLSLTPVEGNGQLIMTDKASGKVIYRMCFSSLFQEWLNEPESAHVKRSFENTFLMPYPKKPALVTVTLFNSYRKACASITHEVNPTDILIHQRGTIPSTPYHYLLQNGTSENCVDVVIMAEGYTKSEMKRFRQDANIACDAIFSHEPFKSMKSKFNIIAVESTSHDSDVSIPRHDLWRNTAAGSNFDTFYTERYLTTKQVKRIHDLLAGIPYEHIIILANTDTYGGGGILNAYTLTTAHHSAFRPVVVHEFGHSFGGLADEYAYVDEPSPYYPYTVEPWEQNISTLVNFKSKWSDLKEAGLVGCFEGAGYTKKGVFRPTDEACRMRNNTAEAFCPVCRRALEQMIRFYTEQQ